MKTATTAFAAVLMFLSVGCVLGKPSVKGSGVAKTEARDVAGFTQIRAGGAFDVNVKIGEPQSVVITGDDNLLPLIQTKVEGNALLIDTTENVSPKTRMAVNIVVPKIEGVSLAGSGDIRVDGVKETELKLSISGSGDVSANGTVEKLTSAISGSGSMQLENLQAMQATVDIAGSGEAAVNVTGALQVSIAGSGDVTYLGTPASVQKNIAGSGSVRQKK